MSCGVASWSHDLMITWPLAVQAVREEGARIRMHSLEVLPNPNIEAEKPPSVQFELPQEW